MILTPSIHAQYVKDMKINCCGVSEKQSFTAKQLPHVELMVTSIIVIAITVTSSTVSLRASDLTAISKRRTVIKSMRPSDRTTAETSAMVNYDSLGLKRLICLLILVSWAVTSGRNATEVNSIVTFDP